MLFDFGEIKLVCFERSLFEWLWMFDGGRDSGCFIWEFIRKDFYLGKEECVIWFKILYMVIK